MFQSFYSDKKVLITGHTGFKGSWLTKWLLELGAEVCGYSVDIPTTPSLFDALQLEKDIHHIQGDIRDKNQVLHTFKDFKPQIIFHLAAQSLVRKSYEDPVTTFESNALGTLNLLEAVKETDSLETAVFITSDKCYRNHEWVWGYRENDQLGGEDPYSASKGCAELIIYSYMHSYFSSGPNIASARAGNVIGGGDWAKDRIVPDAVRAWSSKNSLRIRSPFATRPWQHVLEPLSGYLSLGTELSHRPADIGNQSFNFGPQSETTQSVQELCQELKQHLPGFSYEIFASETGKKESTLLKLCCDKALYNLFWKALLNFKETVEYTGQWYRCFYDGENIEELTIHQIKDYTEKALLENMHWAD